MAIYYLVPHTQACTVLVGHNPHTKALDVLVGHIPVPYTKACTVLVGHNPYTQSCDALVGHNPILKRLMSLQDTSPYNARPASICLEENLSAIDERNIQNQIELEANSSYSLLHRVYIKDFDRLRLINMPSLCVCVFIGARVCARVNLKVGA